MKKLKRIICLCLAVAMLCLCFAGCGKQQSEAKKYKVGVLQLVQHEALDAATQGFVDAVKAELGEENVEIDIQNAGGESTTCATIANQFVADNVDLIMANATPALQAAMAATATIPVVATSITDYATALEIKDWTGKTGINVTGTSDLAPLKDQAKMIAELCPDAKTVGILYCSAEPNSTYQANVISKEFKDMGLDVKIYTTSDTNEIANVTTKAVNDKVDAIYIPTDNVIASAASAVDQIVAPAKIPVFAGEEGICKKCGVATLSISYYSIGEAAGKMAAEILKDGKNPGEMEIGYASELTNEYVKSRADALGITVPDSYTAIEEAAE